MKNSAVARAVDRASFAQLPVALEREWLVTNGVGGYASSTIAQCNTRRYHGLLIAALRPPLDRVLMLSKLDATLLRDGQRVELAVNEYADGTLAPRGNVQLTDFITDWQMPLWRYGHGDLLVEQRLWMEPGANTVYVRYTLVQGEGDVTLELLPLCAYRDYHSHQHGGWSFQFVGEQQRCVLSPFEGARRCVLSVDRGEFVADGEWHWRFHHRQEAGRGLDAEEDLFRPGRFMVPLRAGESVTFRASAEPDGAQAHPARTAEAAPRLRLLSRQPVRETPDWISQLLQAADQFIVGRVTPATTGTASAGATSAGTTVIAGYHWFGDWGRDTMIALPGLTLPTGRLAEAASILRTFALHVDQGMLPNRFPDDGGVAEYNTVDATLWYFHAIAAYLAASDDQQLLRDLYPVLRDIIYWHERGTRYGIHMDPADGLLAAGEPGVQLTWMDAKIGDWVVTARTGKAVEINALWHFALQSLGEWAQQLGDRLTSARALGAAQRVASSFAARFWNEARGYLNDVIDGPEGVTDGSGRRVDASLRPNQIFAISLGGKLLSAAQSRAVLARVARDLLTPVGLRSLSPGDPRYVGRYEGGPRERDASYHQGTVWSWLLGPYALAHYQVYGNAAAALQLLAGLEPHLGEACLGSISEIFDGDAPHLPRGCVAQAWSVAETLRAHSLLSHAAEVQAIEVKHA